MRNVRSRQWLLFALTVCVCLAAFFIVRGAGLLVGLTPTVLAASSGHTTITDKGNCTAEQHGPSFGGAVVVDIHEVECGDLTTFGGTVAITGTVQGDIVSFNSNIVIAGTINGNTDLYGGSIVLQDTAHINGDIHVYGGHETKGPNVQLHGSLIDETNHVSWLFSDIGGFSFSFWSLLIWVALGMLLTSLFPEHVMLVRTTVVSKMRRSALLGLLTILLAPPVLLVLIALILSIPLAIIVGLGLIAAWGLGTVSIGWLVGDYVMSKVAPHRNTRLVQIVVGLTVLVLLGSLPYIGWLISVGVGLLGLGAVFLSRFGTRLYSQPKQPLTL
ncbi:MAG: hypothetical protein ACR2H5_14445 [Ktedonobacteraceae bacterium]